MVTAGFKWAPLYELDMYAPTKTENPQALVIRTHLDWFSAFVFFKLTFATTPEPRRSNIAVPIISNIKGVII